MNKQHLLIIAIMAFATSVFAQHDEQVTVEGTYRPKVNKVNKILLKPNAPTMTFSMPDSEVQPMETDRVFNLELDPINPLGLSQKNNTNVTPTENFLMAGMGTRLSPLFLYKHNSMLTKLTSLGVGVKHFSSWLNIKDYAPSGFMNNSFDVRLSTKKYDNLQLEGKLYYNNDVSHYYGVNLTEMALPDTLFETYCPRQSYNTLGAKFEIQTTSTRLAVFAHHADFDYHYLFDKVYGQTEHSAALNYGISYSDHWWGNKENLQKVGAEATIHYASVFNRAFIRINPYFEMKGDFYRLRVGAKVHTTFSELDDKQFLICPDLKGSLFVLNKKVEFYANLGGGQKLLTYSEIVDENPFVGQWLPLYNQSVKLDFEGGVRTNILETIYLHFGVRYRYANRDLFYTAQYQQISLNESDFILGNKYKPIFDTTKTVSVSADIRWLILDQLGIDLNMAYHHYTTTELTHPLYRPTFEGQLKTNYDFNEKLSFNASVLFQGGRYALDQYSNAIKLKDVIDIALGADYKINNQIAFFAKVDNLANSKYQLFCNYPVTGIQLFAGLKMTF